MANVSSQSRVSARKGRTASFIGASVAPASWTTTAPGQAAPNGRAYVRDADGKYGLSLTGQYVTRAA